MEQVKITVALVIAILLQWTLRNVAEPMAYLDLPLIVVVYAALQQNAIRAIFFGTIAGISIDALSGGLLGSSGFAKTLVAFIVSEIARRFNLDNPLVRIPVIAGACLLNNFVYLGMHQLLGQDLGSSIFETMAYTVLGTTIAGTFIFLFLDSFSTQALQKKKRTLFAPRRQTRRRNPIRLGRK